MSEGFFSDDPEPFFHSFLHSSCSYSSFPWLFSLSGLSLSKVRSLVVEVFLAVTLMRPAQRSKSIETRICGSTSV